VGILLLGFLAACILCMAATTPARGHGRGRVAAPRRALNIERDARASAQSNWTVSGGSLPRQGPCNLVRPAPRRPGEPRIAAAITTSRRPLLFRRAMLSFLMRCLDCIDRVDQWFAVDDGSTPEELAEMRAAVPGLTWVAKPPGAHGHQASLNALLDALDGFDYVAFIEDDFFFVRDEDFVSKSLAVLDVDPSIGQVIFNARYAETTSDQETHDLVGGTEIRDLTTGQVTHILHEYAGPVGSPEWEAFFHQPGHMGKVANVHWPHFSLRNGIWRMSAMRAMGPFTLGPSFEHSHGLRWMEHGFQTAFLPQVYSVHLGKTSSKGFQGDTLDAMYSKYGLRHSHNASTSAYDLNGTIRK
jgi:hypothetical protein